MLNKISTTLSTTLSTNPGNIYSNGTVEDIKNCIQSFRNPGLVILLNKLGYIENYGTGIQRIMEAYKDADCKPEFYVSTSYFMITLHSLNPIEPRDAQNDPQNISIHDHIANLIKENPRITRKQMAKKIGVSKATIERTLLQTNDIKFVGSYKTGHWEIIDVKKQD